MNRSESVLHFEETLAYLINRAVAREPRFRGELAIGTSSTPCFRHILGRT